MPEHFAFIGSDDPNSPGSILLWSESHRILFNCPEGCQRFFGEISERLVAVSHVFFTQFTPHHNMGFPGMLFTVNDAGVQKINVTCPSGFVGRGGAEQQQDEIQRWWGVLRKNYYSINRTMDLKSINNTKTHSFPTFTVTVIPSFSDLSSSNTSTSSSSSSTNNNNDTVVVPHHSYLIQGITTLKFDPEKAKKLGVKPGIKFSQLKSGEAVESDTQKGVFVQPSQVLIPNEQAEAEEKNVLLTDYSTPHEYFSGIIGQAEGEVQETNNERDKNNKNTNTVDSASPTTTKSKPSSMIHTVIHLAKFPLPFHVHKMMQINDRVGVSTISELQTSPTSSTSNGNGGETQTKGMPLYWTEKVKIDENSTNDNDDAAATEQSSSDVVGHYYIRRHIISPQGCPPDSVRITAFPTSLTMRMHLRAVTRELFTDNSIKVYQNDEQLQQSQTTSKTKVCCWPYGPSCFLRLRIPPESVQSRDCNESLFRFPANHLVLPTSETAMEMLSPELRRRFQEYVTSTQKSNTASTINDKNQNQALKWLSFGGTGSAVPNKYRNVSSIGLEYYTSYNSNNAPSKSILLDCGEGTTGQFSLTLGQRGFLDFISPEKLSFIFISHMHADHHFGLFSILSLRKQQLTGEDDQNSNNTNNNNDDAAASNNCSSSALVHPDILPIIAPREVIVYFKDMLNDQGITSSSSSSSPTCLFNLEVGRLNRHFLFIDSEDAASLTSPVVTSTAEMKSIEDIVLSCPFHGETPQLRREVNSIFEQRKSTTLAKNNSAQRRPPPKIQIVPVDHPGSAHGIRLDLMTSNDNNDDDASSSSTVFPRSIMYTGDTRPCQNVIDSIRLHPQPLDVLIHESTFDSSMKEEAAMKMHSTVDEAIGVATANGKDKVKYLMLNHFSQRYPKLSTGARIEQKQQDDNDNNNNASTSTSSPLLSIGASCDLLYLEGNIDRFNQLRDAIPYFGELLEEYDTFAGGGSLSRRLRSGMSATDKTASAATDDKKKNNNKNNQDNGGNTSKNTTTNSTNKSGAATAAPKKKS